MIHVFSLYIILMVSSMPSSIGEDLGGYRMFYENVISDKGETYSFIVNDLFKGVDALDGTKLNREFMDCLKHLVLFHKAYQKKEIWALKMIDSSGQMPSGFLQGNIVDLGNFGECIALSTRSNNFTGQHCLLHYDVDAESMPTVAHLFHVTYGICVPSSCSKQHVQQIFISSQSDHLPYIERCETKESIRPHLGALEAIILSCFGVLGAILLIGTGYDIYLRKEDILQSASQMSLLDSAKECKRGNHKYHRCLLAFSCLTNGQELFQVDQGDKSIRCLYGLRFIGACFVLSVHRILFDPQPFSNVFSFETGMRQWYRVLQLNAQIFVDLFLVIGGMLLAYRYSSHIRTGEKLNLKYYYLHRYIRLTPPLLACVMLDLMLGMLCNGPYCIALITKRDWCVRNAIYTLTYLNNMIDTSRKCVAQSWYLSADMQIYALSPILFFFLKKFRKSSQCILLLCLSTSIFITFAISYHYGLKAGNMNFDFTQRLEGILIYYPFYTRMGPWFIGFGLGLILHSYNNNQYRLGKSVLTFGWLLAIICISIGIFGVHPFNQIGFKHDRITDSLFKALFRNFFGVGFSWLIYACYTGHCDFLDRILSSPVMQLLGKLSYCFFLIHTFVMALQYRSVTESRKYLDFLQGSIILGDICYSIVCAIILHLAVEAPALKLEKILFENRKSGENRAVVKQT